MSPHPTSPQTEATPRTPRPALTLSVCGLLVLLYLASALPHLLSPHPMFLALANLNPHDVVERHQYWRLLSANLSHANLAHLGMNVVSLLIFGSLLEPLIGRGILLAWMFLALLGCDIASLWFAVPGSIGASGIAYGLQTGFVVLSVKVMIVRRTHTIGRTLHSLLGYIVLMLLLNTIDVSHINVYGHMGGALGGFIGAVLYPVLRPLQPRDALRLAVALGLALLLLAWVMVAL